MSQESQTEERRSVKRTYVCKCPMCGARHKKRMLWIGNGTPRIFCNDCLMHDVDDVDEFEDQVLTVKGVRV